MATASEKFRELLENHDEYRPQAYDFIRDALDYALKHLVQGERSNQHLSGTEICEGVRRLGIKLFGPLAEMVLGEWGVKSTEDLGELVFNLVKHNLMGKQDRYVRRDFNNVYDFEEAFDVRPVFYYAKDAREWTVDYVSR